MLTGIVIGLSIGFVGHLISMNPYENILVMKSKDGSSEHIHGNFYNITEENKKQFEKDDSLTARGCTCHIDMHSCEECSLKIMIES